MLNKKGPVILLVMAYTIISSTSAELSKSMEKRSEDVMRWPSGAVHCQNETSTVGLAVTRFNGIRLHRHDTVWLGEELTISAIGGLCVPVKRLHLYINDISFENLIKQDIEVYNHFKICPVATLEQRYKVIPTGRSWLKIQVKYEVFKGSLQFSGPSLYLLFPAFDEGDVDKPGPRPPTPVVKNNTAPAPGPSTRPEPELDELVLLGIGGSVLGFVILFCCYCWRKTGARIQCSIVWSDPYDEGYLGSVFTSVKDKVNKECWKKHRVRIQWTSSLNTGSDAVKRAYIFPCIHRTRLLEDVEHTASKCLHRVPGLQSNGKKPAVFLLVFHKIKSYETTPLNSDYDLDIWHHKHKFAGVFDFRHYDSYGLYKHKDNDKYIAAFVKGLGTVTQTKEPPYTVV